MEVAKSGVPMDLVFSYRLEQNAVWPQIMGQILSGGHGLNDQEVARMLLRALTIRPVALIRLQS